jgi:hypothetical protein
MLLVAAAVSFRIIKAPYPHSIALAEFSDDMIIRIGSDRAVVVRSRRVPINPINLLGRGGVLRPPRFSLLPCNATRPRVKGCADGSKAHSWLATLPAHFRFGSIARVASRYASPFSFLSDRFLSDDVTLGLCHSLLATHSLSHVNA